MPLPRAIARFNRSVTNKVARRVAGWAPALGVVTHRGRRTGTTYTTPVNVFRRTGGFTFALTYGRGDWVRNVLAAGSFGVRTRRRTYVLTNPTVVHDPTLTGLPVAARAILRVLHVDELLVADTG